MTILEMTWNDPLTIMARMVPLEEKHPVGKERKDQKPARKVPCNSSGNFSCVANDYVPAIQQIMQQQHLQQQHQQQQQQQRAGIQYYSHHQCYPNNERAYSSVYDDFDACPNNNNSHRMAVVEMVDLVNKPCQHHENNNDHDDLSTTETTTSQCSSSSSSLSSSSSDTITHYTWHYTQKGETLAGICLKYRIRPLQLRRANGVVLSSASTSLSHLPNPLKIPGQHHQRQDDVMNEIPKLSSSSSWSSSSSSSSSSSDL